MTPLFLCPEGKYALLTTRFSAADGRSPVFLRN